MDDMRHLPSMLADGSQNKNVLLKQTFSQSSSLTDFSHQFGFQIWTIMIDSWGLLMIGWAGLKAETDHYCADIKVARQRAVGRKRRRVGHRWKRKSAFELKTHIHPFIIPLSLAHIVVVLLVAWVKEEKGKNFFHRYPFSWQRWHRFLY